MRTSELGIKHENLIAITSDIDWAPDEIINHFLSIVNNFGVRVTFFCTHDISSIKGIEKHELAIHPNFSADRAEREVLRELKALFPEAKGIRSHCLYFHSRLFDIYRELGLKYDSNYLIHNQIVHPFYIAKDVLELPIYFMDDKYLHFGGRFQLDELDLSQLGLKIFGFHPIHIFLNTNSLEVYESAKKYYQQPKQLENYKNHNRGIKDLFIELLSYIRENEIPTYTLGEINDLWRQNRLRLDGLVKDRGTYD